MEGAGQVGDLAFWSREVALAFKRLENVPAGPERDILMHMYNEAKAEAKAAEAKAEAKAAEAKAEAKDAIVDLNLARTNYRNGYLHDSRLLSAYVAALEMAIHWCKAAGLPFGQYEVERDGANTVLASALALNATDFNWYAKIVPSSFDKSGRNKSMFSLRRNRDGDNVAHVGLACDLFFEFEEAFVSGSPTAKDVKLAKDLVFQMIPEYNSEMDRVCAVRSVLNNIFADMFFSSEKVSDNAMTDGTWTLEDGSFVVHAEFKNELCSTSKTEPIRQLACYYAAGWAKKFINSPHPAHVAPTLLLNISGPYLMISGGAWMGVVPVVQPLTPFVPFTLCFDSHLHSMQARAVLAMRVCAEKLRALYQRSGVAPKDGFPSYRVADMPQAKSVPVRYTATVKAPVLYRAMVGEVCVLVKYVRERYGLKAHEEMAQLGHAPKVITTQKCGTWTIVVMEDLVGARHWNRGDKATLGDALSAAVQALHGIGWAHGDLREPNVLVVPVHGQSKVYLVDFDWACESGAATYPLTINTDSDIWVDGVGPGQPILISHDDGMLAKLLA